MPNYRGRVPFERVYLNKAELGEIIEDMHIAAQVRKAFSERRIGIVQKLTRAFKKLPGDSLQPPLPVKIGKDVSKVFSSGGIDFMEFDDAVHRES